MSRSTHENYCVPYKHGNKFTNFLQCCPGSPFHVPVKDEVNPQKVKCYGPGLDSKNVQAGKPATFTVDTTEAGEAPVDVHYKDTSGMCLMCACTLFLFNLSNNSSSVRTSIFHSIFF